MGAASRYLAGAAGCLALILPVLAGQPAMANTQDAIPTAVAEFFNDDTAGEDADRTARHAARVQAFDDVLGESLAAGGRFRPVAVPCPDGRCSAETLSAEEMAQAARRAGARVLVLGGIHKMSTLVQWGALKAVDLESGKVLLSRTFSFRGDNDEAFRRAALFLVRYFDQMALAK